MKEEITNAINEKLDEINPTLEDIYNSQIITNKIEKIRKENGEYKRDLIKILDNLKNMGVEIEYSEEMSIEELENIVDKIKA